MRCTDNIYGTDMLSKLKSLKWPGSNSTEDGAAKKSDSPGKPGITSSEPPGPATASAKSIAEAQAALKDPSEKKRLAAISNIDDAELLLSTALQDHSEAVKDSAARQYAKHLVGGDATRTLVRSYINDADKRQLALAITAHHKDAEIRDYGSSLLTDESLSLIHI